MKTIQLDDTGAGMDIVAFCDDLLHLSEAIEETSGALANALGDCYLTDTQFAYVSLHATTVAGYMIYKGEICAFDAQSVLEVGGETLAWVPVITYRDCDPIPFTDSSTKNVHQIKKVQLAYYSSAPADYIDFDQVGLMGPAWQDITLNAHITAAASCFTPAYRQWPDGKVEIRGAFDGSDGDWDAIHLGSIPYGPANVVSFPILMTGVTNDDYGNARLIIGVDGSLSMEWNITTANRIIRIDGVPPFYLK